MTTRESLLAAIALNDGVEALVAWAKLGPALLAALDDAERYRWLREFDPLATKCVFLTNSRDDLDAAIDAARKA